MRDDHRILVVGAGPTAQALGRILARTNEVVLVDNNREHCLFAEAAGLRVVCGNALQDEVLREAGAAHAATCITLTPNAEVNALVAQQARSVFAIPEIHILRTGAGEGHAALTRHLHATTLFGSTVTLPDWDYWIQHDRVERTGLTLERSLTSDAFLKNLRVLRADLPLALRRGDRYMPYHSGSLLQPRDRVILLRSLEAQAPFYDRFDRLVARCPILDINRSMSAEAFFELVAAALAASVDLSPDALLERFLDRETAGSTVIAPGLAIPHALIDGIGQFQVLMARCREGVWFPDQREPVHAVFVLVRSYEERNFHLRTLAAIAQVVQNPAFESRWLLAGGQEELRKLVLEAERRRYPEVNDALDMVKRES